MFAPTDVCGVIKGCEINNNAKCQGGVGCRGRQPLQIVRGSSLCRKIATLFADLHLLRARVGGADFVLRYGVCLIYGSRVLFSLNLHLVGLRRMRLCLKLRSGLCPKNPQGTLSLDPASPLTPGLSLRLSARYARCWVHNSGQLCSFLIPHSSFLIHHSSLYSLYRLTKPL